MAGRIKQLIDTIIEKRSKGNEAVVHFTRVKLVMKGINPDEYNERSSDDPIVIARLKEIAAELGITL